MMRFGFLERLGVWTAALSEASDGDCGLKGGDSTARERVCGALGISANDLVRGEQVHGTRIVQVRETDRGRGGRAGLAAFPATDGLMTDVPGLPLVVSVADCVPVYLADPVLRCGALLHAGREGTRLGITAAAVAAVERAYGTPARDLYAFIGPSAGPCCYEVSPEMAEEFAALGFPIRGRNLDLWRANAEQLEQGGLRAERIGVAGTCTICTSRFHSYRRTGDGRRNMAILCM